MEEGRYGNLMETYDHLIVGAGLYGAVTAYRLKEAGKRVLVIDRRPCVGGNVYTEKTAGINVHKYGAHIFHTNDREVWEFVNRFAQFNRFTNSPVANYKGELYSLPLQYVHLQPHVGSDRTGGSEGEDRRAEKRDEGRAFQSGGTGYLTGGP